MALGGASLGTAVLHLITDFTGMMTGLAKAQTAARGRTAAIAASMTKFVTLPILAGGIAAGVMAASFEKSMSQIEGLVGVSREQVKAWSDDVLALATDLPQSPKELAEALFFVTSSGIDTSKAMEVLEASAKAAAAGLGETKVVADVVTSAMNAYAQSGLSAIEATDILTAAVREGKGEPDEMAGALGAVIPIAAEMGVEFHEVSGALAAMTLTGSSASRASTQVRAILSSLLKPTVASAKAMREMGFSADGIRESIREKGLFNTLMDLKGAVGDNEEAWADLFPNVRALNGVLSLTGENSKTNAKLFEEMADATGATEAAFAAAAETASFKWNAMLSSLQVAAIRAGNVLLPFLKVVMDGVGEVINIFGKLPGPVRAGVIAFLLLVAVTGPLIALFAALTTTTALVIGALVALALGLKFAWENSQTFRTIVGDAFAWIEANVFPILRDFQATAIEVFNAIRQIVTTVISVVRAILSSNLLGIRTMWNATWQSVRLILQGVWNHIKIIIQTALNIIRGVIDVVLGIITGDWRRVWNGLKTIVGSIITGIIALVRNGLGTLARVAFTLAKGVATSIWEGIQSVIGLLSRLGGKLISAVGSAISSAASAAFGLAALIGQQIVSGVLSGVGGLAGALQDKVTGAISSALGSLNPFSPVEHGGVIFIGEPIIEGALTAIEEGIRPLRLGIEDAISRAMPESRVGGAGTGTGGRDIFGKLADTVNFFERQEADVIIGDLGNRIALRTGALA